VTYDSAGQFSGLSGELFLPTLLAWVTGAFVLGSRLWRVIPAWRDRSRRVAAPPVPADS
jgi:hypothetical protein